MNIRFNTAGFLAAATLLSGSAFAFAPEFTGDLPTVIITDQLAAPSSQFDLAQPGPATSGIFRFSGAFDLHTYINNGNLTSGEKAVIRWAFTESKVGAPSPETAANGTLLINDEASVTNPPTSSELATAPLLGSNATLNFWNKDFSGTNTALSTPPVTPFDYLSDITTPTHDLAASGPQERVVTIYVRGDDAAVDFKSFSVITKIGEGDSLSSATGPVTQPVDPFVNVLGPTNDFSGWTQFSLDYFVIYFNGTGEYTSLTDANKVYLGGATQPADPSPGDDSIVLVGNPTVTSGHTYTPATTPAAAATTSLTAVVSGSFTGPYGSTPKVGLSAWERTISTTVNGNSIYRVRTTLARSSAALREAYRVRVGTSSTHGQAITLYNTTTAAQTDRPYLSTTAADHYTYLLAKTSASGNTSLAVAVDAYSLGTLGGGVGSGVVLSGLEISAAPRTDLTGANVLFNRGAASIPTLASGEAAITAPASPTALSVITSGTPSGGNVLFSASGATTTLQPRSATVTSGAINYTVGAATGGTFPRQISIAGFGAGGSTIQTPEGGWTWASIFSFSDGAAAASNPTATGLFPVATDKLYIADIYASSAQAGTALAQMPTMRVRVTTGATQESQTVFELNSANGTGIATAPKIYSVVARSNGLAGVAGLQGHLFIDFYQAGISQAAAISSASRTITIHRIVVTEYADQ